MATPVVDDTTEFSYDSQTTDELFTDGMTSEYIFWDIQTTDEPLMNEMTTGELFWDSLTTDDVTTDVSGVGGTDETLTRNMPVTASLSHVTTSVTTPAVTKHVTTSEMSLSTSDEPQGNIQVRTTCRLIKSIQHGFRQSNKCLDVNPN